MTQRLRAFVGCSKIIASVTQRGRSPSSGEAAKAPCPTMRSSVGGRSSSDETGSNSTPARCNSAVVLPRGSYTRRGRGDCRSADGSSALETSRRERRGCGSPEISRGVRGVRGGCCAPDSSRRERRERRDCCSPESTCGDSGSAEFFVYFVCFVVSIPCGERGKNRSARESVPFIFSPAPSRTLHSTASVASVFSATSGTSSAIGSRTMPPALTSMRPEPDCPAQVQE